MIYLKSKDAIKISLCEVECYDGSRLKIISRQKELYGLRPGNPMAWLNYIFYRRCYMGHSLYIDILYIICYNNFMDKIIKIVIIDN